MALTKKKANQLAKELRHYCDVLEEMSVVKKRDELFKATFDEYLDKSHLVVNEFKKLKFRK